MSKSYKKKKKKSNKVYFVAFLIFVVLFTIVFSAIEIIDHKIKKVRSEKIENFSSYIKISQGIADKLCEFAIFKYTNETYIAKDYWDFQEGEGIISKGEFICERVEVGK